MKGFSADSKKQLANVSENTCLQQPPKDKRPRLAPNRKCVGSALSNCCWGYKEDLVTQEKRLLLDRNILGSRWAQVHLYLLCDPGKYTSRICVFTLELENLILNVPMKTKHARTGKSERVIRPWLMLQLCCVGTEWST